MVRRIFVTIAMVIVLSPTAFLFQNCGKGFEAGMEGMSSLSFVGPNIAVSQAPGALINVRTATVQFTVNATTVSTLVRTSCSFDNAALSDCADTYNMNDLQDGDHALRIEAEDSRGNISEQFVRFQVDATVPVVTVNSGPAAVTGVTSASIAFTATDNLSGVIAIECSYNGAAYAACTSPRSFSGLAQASHTLQIRARDNAGNMSAEVSHNWRVDMTAPVITIATGPTPISNSRSATFTFTGTDDGVAISSFQCSIDNGAYSACTSPATMNVTADGNHTFSVRGMDGAGNASQPVSRMWSVDTVLPTITQVSAPPALTNQTSATFQFTANDGAGSGIARSECSLNSAAFTACVSPATLSGLASTAHNFQMRAVDNAGNVSAAIVYNWRVDTLPPVVTLVSAPPATTSDTNAAFTFTATESGSVLSRYECALDNMNFATCTTPRSYSGLALGNHTFYLRAVDSLGNTSEPLSHSWTIVSGLFNTLTYERSLLTGPGDTGSEVYGTAVYISQGYAGLRVIDYSNPAAPRFVTAIRDRFAGSLIVHNNYLYSLFQRTISVYSLSNPLQPTFVGSYTSANLPNERYNLNYVGADGTKLYVGYMTPYTCGFEVVDVSNPANPIFNGTVVCPSGNTMSYITARGGVFYVSTYSGLFIFDARTPTAPRYIGEYRVPDASFTGYQNPYKLKIVGSLGYLVTGNGHFNVLSLANPTVPTSLSYIRNTTVTSLYDMEIVGNYAYVTSFYSGTSVVNIANSYAPSFVTTDANYRVSHLKASGSVLYGFGPLANGYFNNGIHATPTSNLPALTPSGRYLAPQTHSAYMVNDYAIVGGNAQILLYSATDHVTGTPGSILSEAMFGVNENAILTRANINTNGYYYQYRVYSLNGASPVQLYSRSSSSDLPICLFNTNFFATCETTANSRLSLARITGGTVQSMTVPVASRANGAATDRNLMAVSFTDVNNVVIFSISGNTLVETARLPKTGTANPIVALSEDKLYLSETGGIGVYSLANPAQPARIATIPYPANNRSTRVAKGVVYFMTSEYVNGVQVGTTSTLYAHQVNSAGQITTRTLNYPLPYTAISVGTNRIILYGAGGYDIYTMN